MPEPDVSRETNDESTGRPVEGITPADAHLTADLQRVYHSYAASNARSLERVQARLEQRGARLARSKSAPPPSNPFPSRLPPKERTMKSRRSFFAQGSTTREVISVLAACLVLAVLVGSMFTVFTLARQSKGSGNSSQHNNAVPTAQGSPIPPAQNSPVPTEAPPPPATSGVYIDMQTGDDDWNDYQIAKIDPQTRVILWKQDVGALTSYPPIVYGNTVYVASGDATEATLDTYVYALNATSGAVRWKVTFPSNVQNAPNGTSHILNVLGTPTIDNGTLYISDRAGTLYALNATTGARLWSYSALSSGIITLNGNETDLDPLTAAAANGVVYGAIYDELYAVNARNGKLLWMKQIDDTQLFTAPVLADGVIYITSTGPGTANTYAFATKDGKLLWKDPIGSSNSSLTIEQGTIYLGADMLYVLNASNGSQLWHFNTGGPIPDQPRLENGIVYVDGGTGTPMVFAVDASSGKQVWQKPVENLAWLQAVQDGVVYLGVFPGQLYTLSATDGSVLWHQRFGPALIDKTGRESESPPNITVIG